MNYKKLLFPVVITFGLLLFSVTPAYTWGFYAHKQINHLAVFILPPEMISFYKQNIDYITLHAPDADKRRYAVEEEGSRHYIDLDHYGLHPFDTLPKKWKDATEKFSEDTLNAYGIVPWYVERLMYYLTESFKKQNKSKILYWSANLGHYIADAHVPLHTTENYNGQLTGQIGIHAFWESRVPELFAGDWNFFTGKAKYVDNINETIWHIVQESFLKKDSVLNLEKELSKSWPVDKRYTHDKGKKVFTSEYAQAYNKLLNGMVERRMRAAIFDVGSFWYTAWVNAGQPELSKSSDSVMDNVNEMEEGTIKKVEEAKGHEE